MQGFSKEFWREENPHNRANKTRQFRERNRRFLCAATADWLSIALRLFEIQAYRSRLDQRALLLQQHPHGPPSTPTRNSRHPKQQQQQQQSHVRCSFEFKSTLRHSIRPGLVHRHAIPEPSSSARPVNDLQGFVSEQWAKSEAEFQGRERDWQWLTARSNGHEQWYQRWDIFCYGQSPNGKEDILWPKPCFCFSWARRSWGLLELLKEWEFKKEREKEKEEIDWLGMRWKLVQLWLITMIC